ncbi:MAG: diacylglycerol kinase [Chromatiales bacterium]|jgi:diacylglycerol kinase (ATP)
MAYQNAKGIRRLVNAFRFSMKGFRACFKHEEAFRQEVYASIVVIPLGIWLGETGLERAVLVGSWMIVPLTELLNSAVEAAIDRIGPERHKLSGRAKDIGSAAVLFSLVLAASVWGLLLLT